MWSRAQLKGRAKATFKRNYWKCILISLLLTLIAGGSGAASGNISSATGSLHGSDNQAGSSYDYDSSYDSDDGSLRDFEAGLEEGFKDGLKAGNRGMMGGMVAAAIAIGILIVVFLVIFVLILLVDVFIINPLEVGCRRFFIRNLNEPAQIGNIGYGFDNNYRNVAKTMFFRDLFTVLWSLLFIIPGIIKSYSYSMAVYIKVDHPDYDWKQCIDESQRMMQGHKWELFVLDLSFIGWLFVGACCCGVGTLWVNAYMAAAHSQFYENLRRTEIMNNVENVDPQFNAYAFDDRQN